MGMFDEIRCEVPLPDGAAMADVWFQTKSFPAPCLQRYVITHSGRLLDSVGHDLEVDGYVTFYITDGSPHSWREYRARFRDGQLLAIVIVAGDERGGAVRYGLASFRWFAAPSFMFGDVDGE